MQYIRTVFLIFCDCELIPKYSLSKKQQKTNKKTPVMVQMNKVEKQYFKMILGLFHI